jgi:hypothetical protein
MPIIITPKVCTIRFSLDILYRSSVPTDVYTTAVEGWEKRFSLRPVPLGIRIQFDEYRVDEGCTRRLQVQEETLAGKVTTESRAEERERNKYIIFITCRSLCIVHILYMQMYAMRDFMRSGMGTFVLELRAFRDAPESIFQRHPYLHETVLYQLFHNSFISAKRR